MKIKGKKILITCGPTWVPVDDMRIISNKSTGWLGHIAAFELARHKAKVTLLEGPVLTPLTKSKNIKTLKFIFYDELVKLMKNELKKKYDIVIHAAAVSDYRLKKPFKKKLGSEKKELKLNLIRTEKIIDKIKRMAPEVFLVGFKLETTTTKASAKKNSRNLFEKAKCDLVIANSIRSDKYHGLMINSKNKILADSNSRQGIIKKLIKILRTEDIG